MAKRKNGTEKFKILIVILSIVILGLVTYIVYTNSLPASQLQSFSSEIAKMMMSRLSTNGFTEVNITVDIVQDMGVVTLMDNCYEVAAVVEPEQAISIQNGIEGKVGPRPNVHDLFNDLLKSLNIKILMVKITDMKDQSYYSRMILQQGNTILDLDSRPSDAIAIAARTDYIVPIYMNETLMKSLGKKIC